MSGCVDGNLITYSIILQLLIDFRAGFYQLKYPSCVTSLMTTPNDSLTTASQLYEAETLPCSTTKWT